MKRLFCLPVLVSTAMAGHVLLEAEQFADAGGWDVDQPPMEQMGSPYLLAHGCGVPVRDAVTMVTFSKAGNYRRHRVAHPQHEEAADFRKAVARLRHLRQA